MEVKGSEQISGEVGIVFPRLECGVPALSFTLLGNQIGVFLGLEARGGVKGTGGLNPCTEELDWSYEVFLQGTASVSAKAEVVSPDFLGAEAKAATTAVVSAKCTSASPEGEIKLTWKPLVLSGKVKVAGFINPSFEVQVFDAFMTDPVEFPCPNPF